MAMLQTARQRVRTCVLCVECATPMECNAMVWVFCFWLRRLDTGRLSCTLCAIVLMAMASSTAQCVTQRAANMSLSRRSKHHVMRCAHKPSRNGGGRGRQGRHAQVAGGGDARHAAGGAAQAAGGHDGRRGARALVRGAFRVDDFSSGFRVESFTTTTFHCHWCVCVLHASHVSGSMDGRGHTAEHARNAALVPGCRCVSMSRALGTQVRSMWRSRRAKWRQLTKVAEAVPELGVRLSEFRSALLTDSTFVGCGATWQVPWSAVYSSS